MHQKEYKLLGKLYSLKKVSFSIKFFIGLIYVFILITSVGYAATDEKLSISGETIFRVEADIRVTDLKLISATNGGMEEYNSKYSKTGIITGINLPNLDSTITYEVTVTNVSNVKMRLENIINENFSNTDIEYILTDINLNDVIPEMGTKIFRITFKYSSNIGIIPPNQILESRLEFVFTKYDIIPPVISEVAGVPKTFYITQTGSIDLSNYATAFDDVDGDITHKIVISSSPEFNKNKAGTYEITYNVQDAAGNFAVPLKITIVMWNFTKIDSGSYHTLALTSHGRVYVWGYGAGYRSGLGSTSDVRVPTVIPNLYNIVDISAARESSYAVDSNGYLWVWGTNTNYRLGDNTTTTRQTPTRINPPDGEKFIQVSAHYATGAALTDAGYVYTWGWVAYGATGFGNTGDIRQPTKVPGLSNIKKINMGYYNGAAIDTNGDLYLWGTNYEAQLGLGYSGANSSQGITAFYNKPIKHTTLVNIQDIDYGVYHGVAVATSGQVYTWGTNSYGRLGNGTASTNSYNPVALPITNAVSCAINEYNTAVVTDNNECYAWGGNDYGEVGIGNTSTNVTTPTVNPQVTDIVDATCAWDSSFVLTKDSQVYGFGYGGTYVLGNNTTSSSATKQLWSFTPPNPE